MKLHPFSTAVQNPDSTPTMTIDATLDSLADGYQLSISVEGSELERIEMASRTEKPSRKNELWKQTCFECFFGVANSTRYFEFNGSPSGDWAIYSFEDYRKGMAEVQIDQEPVLKSLERTSSKIEMVWFIPYFTKVLFQNVGITAVIQKRSAVHDSKSIEYWALKHAGEKPDFHLRKSFAIRLF